MPPAILSTRATAYLRELSAMPSKSWGLGQRPGRHQTLTPDRCGTFRRPTIPATRKHDHNSDNHPKSPDLNSAKPYDINSARNKYTAKAIVGIASPVVGVITSFQEQIEWHLRIASLLVGLAVGILSLVAMVRKMRGR